LLSSAQAQLEKAMNEALERLRSELEAAAAKDKADALAAQKVRAMRLLRRAPLSVASRLAVPFWPSRYGAPLQAAFQAEKDALVADYERQIKELKECKARLRSEHAAAMAALRAEMEAAMAKALADLEARLKAEHAAEIERLLADAAAKLAAALAALRAELEAEIAALKAQAERDAAAMAAMRAELEAQIAALKAQAELDAAAMAKLRKDLDEAGATTFYYEKVRLELDAALELPIGKTVSRIMEIIEELGVFQARPSQRALLRPSSYISSLASWAQKEAMAKKNKN